MISAQKSVTKTRDRLSQTGRETGEQSSRRAPLDPLLELQDTIGNQAVLQLLRSGAIQAKLAINLPGDVYEQEADRIAEQVVVSSAQPSVIQRKCACGGTLGPTGECEKCRNKRLSLQRETMSSEPAARNLKLGSQEHSRVPPIVPDSPGQPLEPARRGLMESQFGHDFSEVR